MLPQKNGSDLNIPTMDTNAEELLKILADFKIKDHPYPDIVGSLTEGPSSKDNLSHEAALTSDPEHKPSKPKKNHSLLNRNPSHVKPPAGTSNNTLKIAVFVYTAIVLFCVAVLIYNRIGRRSAAWLDGREQATEPPLTSMALTSLSGLNDTLFDLEDSAEKFDKEKKSRKRSFNWRSWKLAQPSSPENVPVPATADVIQVPLSQVDHPLEEVVCIKSEAFKQDATVKPIYTGSGLTEVSI
ncbi:hypothetical protein DPEC_G00154570 [Dallia pectoralis]|uniref:Uncharacterized protein n=1 Tax=Dallia pectoralis TaxID=75939 RepID=A0ACC2GK83_DALPE|nr:hypothetical protein DPEC_G00154570 [Dallia pectoralis]